MVKVLKIAILASTKGTDMQAIIDAINSNTLDVEISIVISNKKDSLVLEKAKNNNIPHLFIDNQGKEREEYDKELSEELDKHNIDLILLIGYMKLLTPWFVNNYKNKIINIHPSLLPKFPGGIDKKVHQQVLESGVKESGCTLHFVDEDPDTGPIILQKSVDIDNNETVDSLKEKVQTAEQEIIVRALHLFSKDKIKLINNKVIVEKD